MTKKVVRIGNASGFWGDDPLALKRQLKFGALDYVNADYLAEVSMSILRKLQNRDPEKGYVQDFIDHVLLAGDELRQSDAKIVTNAGGNNPIGCAIALQKELRSRGIEKRIFAITGDNIVDRLEKCATEVHDLRNMEEGLSLDQVRDRVQSANVYTGSVPVAEAFRNGADIVVAGRISDSALTIGPLMYEFGWKPDDWNLLAAGMIAGHIIECGAQATGGNFTDWQTIKSWDEMAFPIIMMEENGDFTVTKSPQCGGMVTEFTVKEQLVYEIHDPENYYGPDVIADVTSVRLVDEGNDKVRVIGAQGKPSPETWKVSMSYHHGWKASGSLILSAPDALEKAQLFQKLFWERVGTQFEKTSTNFIGYDSTHQALANTISPNEILIQFVAFDPDRSKLDMFSRQLSAMILSGPPGVAVTGGRPKPQEVLKYWPALVDCTKIESYIHEINDGISKVISSYIPSTYTSLPTIHSDKVKSKDHQWSTDLVEVKLLEVCLARSGDKGNTVNIGVLARNELIYSWLVQNITAKKVHEWFKSLCKGTVTRYELDNLNALNFHLTEALDGGGTYSGRTDPQGKTFASALLNREVEVPKEILPQYQIK
ncbi:acyclic terpene utilization AtuA family protein [Marinoscillum sp. MHG1-6]|uniref:acyclic terpene utilization AtuA family protein n=1 Tax=Marinoscillum sp. MHG1-6 TaxID=2959627 RepID=UPI0021577E80|nr:acyclic terpene utilization AtuA family protein [Marinoscillum sp. MHG1-6]